MGEMEESSGQKEKQGQRYRNKKHMIDSRNQMWFIIAGVIVAEELAKSEAERMQGLDDVRL